MKKISKKLFNKVEIRIFEKVRQLEKLYYKTFFHGSTGDDFLLELKKYQNEDGGFGRGMELDFHLPESSPMATSKAFQYLIGMDDNKIALDLIKKGIKYFERTFVEERNGWFAVPEEVNDYPHAPWWHYNIEEGMTVIDRHWGNPSAEIIGYLYKYRPYVKTLDVDRLVNYALDYINTKNEFESFHEIYCFIRLYNLLSDGIAKKMDKKLKEAVQELVTLDSRKWEEYVAKPLDFISSPDANYFGISEEAIKDNLDYWVELLEENKEITPNWEWNTYQVAWEEAREKWTGVLTVKVLIMLDKFGRIQR